MKFILLAFFVTLVSCGSKNGVKKSESQTGLPLSISIGQSSENDIKSALGPPTNVYSNASKNNVYQYKQIGSIEFKDKTAQAFFRDPKNDELYLQFWLQRWSKKKTTTEKIIQHSNEHTEPVSQLICNEEKTTIIYNSENGLVKRVVFYER